MKERLALFRVETEEQLKKIEAMEVPIMEQAIKAYRQITATDEFKEIERLRFLARLNEASALGNARRAEEEKWQSVVADKDAALAEQSAALADKDAALADKDALIAELQARLGESK